MGARSLTQTNSAMSFCLEAHLQPPRRLEHMTLPLTFPCQEVLPGPVGLASCGHREAGVLGDSVVMSCPLNQVHH